MRTQFTYWKEVDGRYLGFLNDYPDHWTQGEDLEDLKEHLRDLFQTLSSKQIPGISVAYGGQRRRVGELGRSARV